MTYQDRLRSEINAILDRKRQWHATWITHEVCKSHVAALKGNGDDREFWEHCGYATTREQVRRCISERTGEKGDDTDAPRFPGFEHLRLYYMVERDGDQVGIPVEDLTDDEIDAKAQLYGDMGDACHAHRDELRRFKSDRRRAKKKA